MASVYLFGMVLLGMTLRVRMQDPSGLKKEIIHYVDRPGPNFVDPPFCVIRLSKNGTIVSEYGYGTELSIRCEWYLEYRLKPSYKLQHVRKCEEGKRFNTRTCECDLPQNVKCRGCSPPYGSVFLICAERHWPQTNNDAVVRDTVRWGTGCKQYKHSYPQNPENPEDWRTCPNDTIYNTQEAICDSPLPLTENGGSSKCRDPSPPSTPPYPTSRIPTALCMDHHRGAGFPPRCCERISPVNNDINRYVRILGTECRKYSHEVVGNASVPTVIKHCPGDNRFSHDTCGCDLPSNVRCHDG